MALRAEHQEAVQRRDAHRRSNFFSPELDLILDGHVTDLRKRLDASKPASDLYNGHLKILEKAEAQVEKVAKQLQAAWAAVATANDTAKALEEKHRLALEHAATLRAATATKADAAGAEPPKPVLMVAVGNLLKRLEEERATSAKLGRGGDTDAALASVAARFNDLQAELAVITTGRDASGDTPMGGPARGSSEPSAHVQAPAGNCTGPAPAQDPAGNCAAMPVPLGPTAQPAAPALPSIADPLQAAAEYQRQHAEEQQRVAQQHGQQAQQLREAQLLEQQILLEQQNRQLQQQLEQASATTVAAAEPATLPAALPVDGDAADRARLVSTAQLLAAGLADDTEAITEARSALRGRLSQAADYGPGWLQEGIDMFHRTTQLEASSAEQDKMPNNQHSAKAQCVRGAVDEDAAERPFDPLDT